MSKIWKISIAEFADAGFRPHFRFKDPISVKWPHFTFFFPQHISSFSDAMVDFPLSKSSTDPSTSHEITIGFFRMNNIATLNPFTKTSIFRNPSHENLNLPRTYRSMTLSRFCHLPQHSESGYGHESPVRKKLHSDQNASVLNLYPCSGSTSCPTPCPTHDSSSIVEPQKKIDGCQPDGNVGIVWMWNTN